MLPAITARQKVREILSYEEIPDPIGNCGGAGICHAAGTGPGGILCTGSDQGGDKFRCCQSTSALAASLASQVLGAACPDLYSAPPVLL